MLLNKGLAMIKNKNSGASPLILNDQQLICLSHWYKLIAALVVRGCGGQSPHTLMHIFDMNLGVGALELSVPKGPEMLIRLWI